MGIKRIKISNFKSFKDLDIELGNLNVLIGANASGKSNFVQLFKFIKDITSYGLSNAISMQGGIEYLKNIHIGSSIDSLFEITCDMEFGFPIPIEKENKTFVLKPYENIYHFGIATNEQDKKYKITKNKLIQKCNVLDLEKIKKNGEAQLESATFSETLEINFEFDNKGNLQTKFKPLKTIPITKDDLLHIVNLIGGRFLPNTIFLERSPLKFYDFIDTRISIYDFDPKLPKKAIPITGKAELEEDGNNLALVLKNLIENEEEKRKLSNLLKNILPFIEDLDIEKFADKYLLAKVKEAYFKDEQYIPASLLSDGTINITALIICLYFEKKHLTIIEEPERNLHPYLISRVANMMKEASKNKQIIVTTHNPELVKHIDLESLLLVSRDKEGFSTVTRASEREDLKVFLQNEMGIEDLYVQNLLG